MKTHINEEYLTALAQGMEIQYTYLDREPADILNGLWLDLNDGDWTNCSACRQLVTGIGKDFEFRVKE